MKIEITKKDLDIIYFALEETQPKPIDHFGQPSLSIGDMSLYTDIRNVVARLKDQDDRWVRAQ